MHESARVMLHLVQSFIFQQVALFSGVFESELYLGHLFLIAISRHVLHEFVNAFLSPFRLQIFATSCGNEFYNKRTFFLLFLLPTPSPNLMCDDFVGHRSSYILRNSRYSLFACFLWTFCDFYRPLQHSQIFSRVKNPNFSF